MIPIERGSSRIVPISTALSQVKIQPFLQCNLIKDKKIILYAILLYLEIQPHFDQVLCLF